MTSRPVSFPQLGCTAQLYDLYDLLPISIYAFNANMGSDKAHGITFNLPFLSFNCQTSFFVGPTCLA